MKRLILPLFLAVAVLCGCSEHTNDSKYRSDCPRFSAMQLSSEEVKAGVPVTITCVESRAGKLLDYTTYDWQVTPAEGVNLEKSAPEGGVYDGKNPTCTVTFPAPGNYTVTFLGLYRGSGQVSYFEENEQTEDGVTARYSANTGGGGGAHLFYLHATLSKKVHVVN